MQQQTITELYRIIQDEQKLYSIKKDQHLQEVHNLLQQSPSQKNQLLDKMALKSTQVLHQLKNTALDVEREVHSVSIQATKAMNSFEQLRNQKQNIEKILNSLSAFSELKRVKTDLPRAIEQKDLSSCLKLAQCFFSIENLIMQEFCHNDFTYVRSLLEGELVDLQKEEFEDSLKKNDLQRISLCACLAKVLSQESENSLDKVQDVHGKELRKKLLDLEELMFDKVNNNYEDYISQQAQEYDFPFLWHFVKILEKVNEQGERFAENILSFYGQEGLNQLQYYLLEEVSNPFLSGVIKRLKQFYDIERDYKITKNTLLIALQYKEINVDSNYLSKLSFYNEEVATITSQFNQFLQHISQLGVQKDTTNKITKSHSINQIFLKLSINNTIFDLLQQYLTQSKEETHLQLLQLFMKAESLQILWNFDKQKIVPLMESKEQLQGNGFHEWLEELFFIVKHAAKQAISTGNLIIASTLISYINSDILADELYQVITQLMNRYLKKEYFSSSNISLNSKFNVHNTFIILLFNIISTIPKYLRTLKSQLYSDMQAGGYQSNSMIVGAIEEMVDVNYKKYCSFQDDKIKILADNLKFTVKDLFEQVKSLSFSLNENIIVEQEREYNKLFSQQFKQVFGPGLEQWRLQLTHANYEALSEQLCHSIAKTLEQIVFSKQYHQIGAIILEKEIRSIINFFPQVTSLHVKQCFVRLQMICETLMLESIKDMEEFLSSSAMGELSVAEFKKISSLRLDLVKIK